MSHKNDKNKRTVPQRKELKLRKESKLRKNFSLVELERDFLPINLYEKLQLKCSLY